MRSEDKRKYSKFKVFRGFESAVKKIERKTMQREIYFFITYINFSLGGEKKGKKKLTGYGVVQ